MLRFPANLSMLSGECDFLIRFEKTAQCGFRSVELMLSYDYDIEESKQALANNKLEYTLYNLSAGDWVADERGIVRAPGREEEFQDGVAAAIRYARALGNKKTSCLVGKTPTGFSSEQIHVMLVESLCCAANMLMKEDISLPIESINHFDISGFHLIGTRQVPKLIDDVGCCSLKIQYDIYHMQRIEGELANIMTQWTDKIGHLQIANSPHCDEPGTGEINYEYLFTVIENLGYNGWAGCEYKP